MEKNKIVKKITKPVIFCLCCVLLGGVLLVPIETFAYPYEPDDEFESATQYVSGVLGQNDISFYVDFREFATNSSDGTTKITVEGERRGATGNIAVLEGYEAITSSGAIWLGFNPARTDQFNMGDAIYPRTYYNTVTNRCYAYYSVEIRTTDDVIVREYESASTPDEDCLRQWTFGYNADSPYEISMNAIQGGKYYRIDASRTTNTSYRTIYIDFEWEIEPLEFTDTYVMLRETLNFKGNIDALNYYSMDLGNVDFYAMAREGYATSTGISGEYFTFYQTGADPLPVYNITTNTWITDDYPQCKTFYMDSLVHDLAEQVWYYFNIIDISNEPIDADNPLDPPDDDDTNNEIVEMLFSPVTALFSVVLYDTNGLDAGGEITVGDIWWTLFGILLFSAFLRYLAGG